MTAYNPEWPGVFEREKQRLLTALLPVVPTIEHIGSTAVPGLIAKPIIDIMIGLADFSAADSLVPTIQSHGYEYFPQYEDIMPYRRFFKKTDGDTVTHHIHMVRIESDFWIRHLLFRDFLTNHTQATADYAALKSQLAHQDWNHTNDYADAKTDFIRAIEKKAGFRPDTGLR
ncbi:MAG: GrpB family protein [Planctomycetota bacterium]|jgi:GrpB-like predicted nucleotidyltransferase (UPF0157 family)